MERLCGLSQVPARCPALLLLACTSGTGGLSLCLELSWHLAESSGVTGGREGGALPVEARAEQCEGG